MENLNSLPKSELIASEKQKFIARVYGWMTVALLLSGAAAWFTASSETLLRLLFGNGFGFMILAVAEIALVWWLSASIRKISSGAAVAAFLVYSLINGVTLASVFLVYTGDSLVSVFGITALMFGVMSVFGLFTKSDLNSAGRYLMMALVGILIASLVNFLLRSSRLDWIISVVSVVVFTGLAAYDSQKIARAAVYADGSEVFHKAAVIGALELYLDFINIFLSLLRLFGKRKN